jgi:hypothetical protein
LELHSWARRCERCLRKRRRRGCRLRNGLTNRGCRCNRLPKWDWLCNGLPNKGWLRNRLPSKDWLCNRLPNAAWLRNGRPDRALHGRKLRRSLNDWLRRHWSRLRNNWLCNRLPNRGWL